MTVGGLTRRALAALAALAALGSGAVAREGAAFEDATAAAGLVEPLKGMMCHAAACGDVDGDGDLDLYVGTFCDRPAASYKPAPGPVPNVLLINEGGRFRPAAGAGDVAFRARTSGAVFADLDNDGDLDLYVANNSKRRGLRVANRLFENVGGRFRDVSKGNAACLVMGGRSVGVLDFNGDGRLDLLVAGDSWTGGRTRLFRNAGRLGFEDATAAAGLPERLPALGVLTPDLNGDGWPDLFVAQANRLFLSKGDGTYREDAAASRSLQYEPLGREDTPCGAAFGDVNGDGLFDLSVVDHNQPARQHLFLRTGSGANVTFRDATRQAGLAYIFPSWTADRRRLKHAHVEMGDFDNDGRCDILIAAIWLSGGTEQPFLCRNLTPPGGEVRFDVPPLKAARNYFSAGPAADYDRDGRLDVMFASWLPNVPSMLLLNRSAKRHWLAVRVVGRTINRMGIGSKVRLYAAGKLGRADALLGVREIHVSNGYCSGQEAVAHFGLGGAGACDVEVVLPFGRGRLTRRGVRADQRLVVEQP